MQCISCKSEDNRTVDTRPTKEGKTRRRLVCNKCETRFTTYEITESEYKEIFKKKTIEQVEIHSLRQIIDWLLRSIFSERMNNDINKIKRLVGNPSQEMKRRLIQFDIDLNSYR